MKERGEDARRNSVRRERKLGILPMSPLALALHHHLPPERQQLEKEKQLMLLAWEEKAARKPTFCLNIASKVNVTYTSCCIIKGRKESALSCRDDSASVL